MRKEIKKYFDSGETKFHVTEVFTKNFIAKTMCVINKGGTASSKTHSVLQLLLYRLLTCKNNRKILVLKKCNMYVFKTTVLKSFKNILSYLELESKGIMNNIN